MVSELEYLVAFDASRKRILRVVDMLDRRLTPFIRSCLQGKCRLRKSKRGQFKGMTDEECTQLEQIVASQITWLKNLEEE
ncbi:MAG: hypothetical protein KC964_11965 [Candidatus Omnitrophica bacterium]|nr:hypothetical protein [Candidatus Omnitrophota bacterium]